MESVGVRELRNNVSALLRRAGGGERIIVTVDGVPVAQLGPVEVVGRPGLDDLVATGLVDPPRRPEADVAHPDPIDLAVDVRIDDVLAQLRGE